MHEVPHKPGVYLMRDRFGRVIYVGKARDLRKRVGSYFMPSKVAQADIKTRALLDAVWDFETHTVQSEPESLLLEGKLIKEYRPRYNISFRDDKRFLVVKVDPTEEWPRFRLARFKKDDGARYFGPYAHAGALRQTLNFMRKKFGVLTFGRGSPTERELKSATYQVPTRLSEISAELYRERVAQACDFLEGHSREMIAAVEDEMHKAAGKLDFEKAADLRNMLEDLRRTTKPTRRFTRHSLPSAIDPESDVRALADALQRVIGFARSKARTISQAWRKSCAAVIRVCCSRRGMQIRMLRNFRRRIRRKRSIVPPRSLSRFGCRT